MKKGFGVVAVLVLIGAALCLFLRHNEPAPVAPGLSTENPPAGKTNDFPNTPSNPSKTASPESSGSISSQPPSLADKAGRLVTETSAAALPPDAALRNVRQAIRQYGEMFGGNPVGTNPEIASQLSGNNPRHMNFITAEAGMHVDADGALVDAWGTPYFFHQISGAEMEIHSAGPDRVMWTSDDLVAK